MNEGEQSELAWLKLRQARLQSEIELLARRLEAFERQAAEQQRLAASTAPSAVPVSPQVTQDPVRSEITRSVDIPASPMSAQLTPVPKPESIPGPSPIPESTPIPPSLSLPPIPPIIVPEAEGPRSKGPIRVELPSQPILVTETGVGVGAERKQAAPAGPPPIPPQLPPRVAAAASKAGAPTPKGSLELRLGTYWLVRVGIVMVLTGLVFFGNYAYQNYVIRLGPSGKVAMLYLASAVLLGAGWWWQRKSPKESLKHYAQVLFAGGLAAVYFTTYAAHHFPHLQVIPNARLDGGLLLGWAAFMVWIADRKKSQLLALFAVLLGFYTAIITNVGMFTLYSNLILTAAAVFFLVRNRWAVLSFVGLASSYAAYGYWRFYGGDAWHWPSTTPADGLWTGTYFLIAYWLVFTAAVFLTRDEKFAGANRASFVTANNGAFFSLFLLTMWQVHQGGFWKFALIYGSVLLGLAVLCKFLLHDEPQAKNSYLIQGLLLATVGIISTEGLAGLNLGMILAAESLILLMTGQQRKNRILTVAAYVVAALGVGWGIDGMLQHERHGLWLGVGLGIVMLGNAFLAQRFTREAPAMLRPQVGYFTVLAMVVWMVVTWNNAAREQFALVAAVEAAVLALSCYVLRVREITLLSFIYLGIAQAVWAFDALTQPSLGFWWSPLAMLAVCLALNEWWQRQTALKVSPNAEIPWPPQKLLLPGKTVVLLAGALLAVRLTGALDLINPLIASSPLGVWLPTLMGLIFLADSILSVRFSTGVPSTGLRLQPSYSVVLALITGLAVTWRAASHEYFPLILALEGVVLTLSIYVFRVPEVCLLAQAYPVIAQVTWIGIFGLDAQHLPPWWNPMLLMVMTLGLGHWWQKQKTLVVRKEIGILWQGLYALAIVGILYYWLAPIVGAPSWLALSSLLAVGLTAYGVATRAWLLAAFGQVFVGISAIQFAWQILQGKPVWYSPLAPIAVLGFLSLATLKWFERKPDSGIPVRQPLLQLATGYRWAALLMSIGWVCKYVPERERILVFALLGATVFVLAGWRRNPEALLLGAAYSVSGLALFWLPMDETTTVCLPNLLAIVLLLGQQQVAKRIPERYGIPPKIHGAMIIAGGLSLWMLVTRWVEHNALFAGSSGGYFTACWAALALVFFGCGIALLERIYRWLGLGILTLALGRVMVIDVWKLETIYRILSFMALGIVLLVLGFVYIKFEERIRKWL